MTPIDRRRFLQVALTTLAASGVGRTVLGSGRDSDLGTGPAEQWLPDLDAAAELGRVYLQRHPLQRHPPEHRSGREDLDALERRLFRLEAGQRVTKPDPESLRWLAERVRSDFLAGRVVDVLGWQLAKTEIELCALLALEAR